MTTAPTWSIQRKRQRTSPGDDVTSRTSVDADPDPDVSADTDDEAVDDADATQVDRSALGGERPAAVVVPTDYSAGQEWPLIVMLHGFSVDSQLQDLLFGLEGRADEYGYILILPDGTPNQDGNRFWNATDACCSFYGEDVDDVSYLWGLVEEARGRYAIDNRRIYFIGHSNGGFMSYRMACEHGDEIAAVVSLAGSSYFDPDDCAEAGPVSVLQIHGTGDETVLYDGIENGSLVGFDGKSYPGARELAERWATRAGCADAPTQFGEPIDYDPAADGAETTTESWPDCIDGRGVELWTMEGSAHIPFPGPEFMPTVLEFMFGHPRP